DLGPTSVVEGDGEGHPPVLLGQGRRLVHVPDDVPGHPPIASAREPDADAPLVQLVAAADEDVFVEVDEEPHLVGRAPPVLRRERVHGQPLHPELERALDGLEHRLLAPLVTFGATQPAGLGPPTVAIHHAPDVGRNAFRVDAVDHGVSSAARAASTSLFIWATSASVDSNRSSPRRRLTNRTRARSPYRSPL